MRKAVGLKTTIAECGLLAQRKLMATSTGQCLLTFFLLVVSAGLASGSNLTLDYNENGEHLFHLTAPLSGCHASLGKFPHWCLGNITACAASGFSLGFWFELQPADVTSSDVILLTNGGVTPISDGFYVMRRYGDQIEVGVAIGGNVWRETVRLRTGDVSSHMTVVWNEAAGLTVGIDGVKWFTDVTPSSRSFLTSTKSQEIVTGLNRFGHEVTSSCSFGVSQVRMMNSASDPEVFSKEAGFNDKFLKACSRAASVANETIRSVRSPQNPDIVCRQMCSDAGHTLALLRHNDDCSCADVMPDDAILHNACSYDDWHVYRVHHVIDEHALKLRAWTEMTTGRTYTKPGEDVAFYATHDLDLPSSFTFSFDDGTSLVTSASPIYHAFKTAGVHEVTVTTKVGVIELNATASVVIEDVDEGVEPNMVVVTSWHDDDARAALHTVFVADEHNTNCTVRYGDGTNLRLPSFADFGEIRQSNYKYVMCGRYNVIAECNNTYGQTKDNFYFLARELDMFSSYLPQGEGFNISVAGGKAFLQSLAVEVNGSKISHGIGHDLVTLTDKTFAPATDNLVEVKFEDAILTRHVIRSERRVHKPIVESDVIADAWSMTANITVTVTPCDFTTLTVDFGNSEPPAFVYVQEARDPVTYWHMVTYSTLGAYLVTATLSNDVSNASDSLWVSVEVPITSLNVSTVNITDLTSPVGVTLDVNSGAAGPDRVILTVDYGDGKEPREMFTTSDDDVFQPITLDYVYSYWGIYIITVTARNNISSVSESLLVQVGMNISFVDVTTTTERVQLSENVTFEVICPTGTDVTYTLDFGDGTSFSAQEINPISISNHTTAEILSASTALFTHMYTQPGYYRVSFTATNAFTSMTTTLCPTVVVDDSSVTAFTCSPPTVLLLGLHGNTTLTEPAINKRSAETRVNVQASVNCPQNVTGLHYSWKTVLVNVNERGEVWETTVHSVCRFQDDSSTLVLPPRALPYGLYRLTVTVAPAGYDLVTTTQDLYLQVVMSEPVPIIQGGEVATFMRYATAIFDLSQSRDPDLEHNFRRNLSFHMFCMPESDMKHGEKLEYGEILAASAVVGNKTMFRMTTKNEFWLYEYRPCFNDTPDTNLMEELNVYNGKVRFPASHFSSEHFSFGILLWAEREGLVNMTSQIVEVRTSNMSLDDLGSLLDLALNADPDTAIRLIGGAADAILSADSSSAEEQAKLAESVGAVVDTLGSVAKRVDNANQATKCAGTIKTMTSNSDIVSQGSRASAAGAFMELANGTSTMEDATVDDASSFAGETLGGLNNIFPATVEEKKKSPRELAAEAAMTPETTTVAEIMAARNITANEYSTTPAFTAWSTTTTPTTTTTTTTTTPMPTTTTMVTTTTTPTTTTITMTIPPRSRTGSFTFNGSNYTISGITISTLATTATRSTTASTTTAATPTTTMPMVTTEPPISDWMLEPVEDTQTPYEAAAAKLSTMPEDPTYDELFTYIFDDCLLFRKVMKSVEVQYKCPCMTTSDINLMKCDGKGSMQDRLFDAMTYLEHPDDIYEIYIKALNEERRRRDELRRLTDMEVAGAGNTALGTVADTVNDKSEEGDNTERAFQTPRFGMKLQKVNVNATSNSTDGQEGGAGKQSMGTDVGSFSMPASVLAGASDCPNMNTMFLGDSDNPYTFGEEKSSVGKGVMSLGYSCGGEKVQVADSAEPVEMWMERDAHTYKPGLFVLLTDVSNTNAQFNYHPVNLTDKNSSLQVIIRPVDENEAFDVYVQYDIHPNLTHYDFADFVPKADLSHLAHHESLDTLLPEAKEELLYTVTVPSYLTPENGTYWIGVKLRKGTVSIDDSMSNTSYTLLNLPSGCRFWDETNNTWSSEGCEVGELTSRWKVQCKCTHLTSFGSDAVVPPNTIDFSNVWAKFANLSENAAVFSVIISLLGIYVLLLIFLRYKDKQDLVKWGAMPLEDNLPSDNYHYQLSVYTGVRKNAGTDSRIRFIMSGDESDTGVRRLFDGTRKHFGRGSIFNFVLSVDRSVGNLTFMRIWHDNGGKGKQKSWYLDQIQVTDLQTGEKSIFLCDRWLAVEEDDGMVDRILPVAGIEDLIAFKHLFSSSARKKLANDHLWFSVFSRPTRSNFTRVQRLSCCMSLLFLTMITNAMFFKSEDKQAKTTGITLGPLQFTLGQVFISFISTVIVFPPNFLLVLFYRRCRQKKNAVLQTNQQIPKRNQKYRWKNVGNASAIWGDKARKTKMQKLKESVGGIVASYQKNKYEEDPQELVAAEHRPNGEVDSGKKRKKKPWSLPHWCIYIAWIVCFLSVVGSAFFTILYSMEWGKEKANEWLITFVMSFFQNVIVIQPVKVLFMVAIVSCILKKPDLDEEDMDEDLNKVMSPNAQSAKKNKDPVSLSHVQMERQMGNNEYAPPDTEALSAARNLRMKEIKMEAVIKEMVIYFFFLFIIFFISYQQRDPVSYQFGQNVRNTFLNGFENIKTVTDYWKWLEGTFLPALFVTKYANGTEIKFWQDKACIGDLAARRVGVARIRQMRVKNETCTLQSEMESIINHCRDAYSWTDDDTKDYLPGWELPTEDQRVELKKAETPWVYQNSVQMKNVPYVGTLATYKGGGYALLTRRDMCRTKQMIKAAKDKDWLDLNTRAIFLEFTVYNPNVNLFASHILLTEFLTTGGATSRVDIKIFRLLSYIGGWGLIVLLFEVTFALFTVYFLVRCIRMLKKERLKYFNTFWNILEFALLCLAVSCIVFYSFKHILTKVAMNALKDRESDGFVNFQSIALYDETYAFIMSTVVFLATIQFLKLLQFNKNVGMIGDTIILAIKDLKVFSIAFMLYFMSFVITAYLLFGHMMNTYNNIIGAAESMFAFALGSFDFEAMQTAQPMLGPLFFFSYIMVVYIGLMSIFMTIIGDAFTRVKEDTALQSNEYEIVDFMWGKFKGLLGFK